jgi:chromosome segregation ATPase
MAAKANNNDESNSLESKLHDIHDLTTRIDERVKTIFKLQNETDKKLEKVKENYNVLTNKINAIEMHELSFLNNKISDLRDEIDSLEMDFESLLEKLLKFETDTKDFKNFKRSSEEKIKLFVDIFLKVLITVACGYIGYCLGWNK